MLKDFSGGFGGRETPESIPNSAVKPSSADDTAICGKVGRRQEFFPVPLVFIIM